MVSAVAFCFICALAFIAIFRMPSGHAASDRSEHHPTDENGNYIPAGDNKLRYGRLGLVCNQDIAWYRVGDSILDWRGALRKIVYVDCMANCYRLETAGVDVPEYSEPITFEAVLRINGHPKREALRG